MTSQEQDNAHVDIALVARQPIFDVSGNVSAYELLFRDPAMKPGLAGKTPSAATATVLVDGFELIRPTLRPGQRLFINFTEETLETGLATMLPPNICVVEILEDVRPTPDVLQGLRILKRKGYTLALDDHVGQKEHAAFLSMVDIIKVDVSGKNEEGIRSQANLLREYQATLLAEKVEDLNTMQLCRDQNFSLFQGFFFGKAEIVKGKKLSPAQSTKFRLMSLAANEESKLDSLAEAVMADFSLAFKLLCYINTVHFGLSKKVNTIKQAITLLGRQKFRQWLFAITLAELDSTPMSHELAYTSAVRGKFLEVLAHQGKTVMPSQQNMGGYLFLLGIFSMLENILGIPMEQVQDKLPMEEKILEALAGTGPYAPWLDLIKSYECGAWDKVDMIAPCLEKDSAVLKESYAEAVLWALDIFQTRTA